MRSRLVRALVALVSPPVSQTLSAPQFLDTAPGGWGWHQMDATGKTWGFVSLHLELPDDPEYIQRFMMDLSRIPVVAFKLGLCSKSAQEQTRLWKNTKPENESDLAAALRSGRRDFLQRQLPLRQREGFLVLQFELDDQAKPLRTLNGIRNLATTVAHGNGIAVAPMLATDHIQFELDTPVVPHALSTADIEVTHGHEDAPLALQRALRELDTNLQGSYQAVLTVATAALVPSESYATVRAHCVVRMHTHSLELRQATQRLMAALHKYGLRGHLLTSAAQPMWPTARQARRWPELTGKTLAAYATGATRLPGQPISADGIPLVTEAGELRTFDPFMGPCGNNTLIAGLAGAGRHFLAKEQLVQHLAHPEESAAWVVDDGQNYTQLADALGGTVVQVDGCDNGVDLLSAIESQEALNDNMDLVMDWLGMLAEQSNPVDDQPRHLWSVALAEAWRTAGRPSLRVFHTCLKGLDHPRAHNAAAAFEPYVDVTAGYSRYFLRSLPLPESHLVVLDLADVHELPNAHQRVVTQSAQALVLIAWRQNMCKDQRRKLLLIDDAFLVASPKLLQQMMRRCRILNGGVLLLGRLGDTLHENLLAPVLPMFDHLLVLQSTAEDARRFEQMHFPGQDIRHEIARVRTQAGAMSEVFVLSASSGERARFRFRVDPLSFALYNARSVAVCQYRALRKQGHSPLATLTECSQNPAR